MKSKIKLFSSKLEETNKVSLSIFGSKLPLKIIFNNREKSIKNKFLEISTVILFVSRTFKR